VLSAAADENFNGDAVAELLRRHPGLSIVRVQDGPLRAAPDLDVLAWAAGEGRVLLTHDQATMVAFAFERIAAGLPCPGLVVAPQRMSVAALVEDVEVLLLAGTPAEFQDRVTHLPLR
jgi:hypothetical protein